MPMDAMKIYLAKSSTTSSTSTVTEKASQVAEDVKTGRFQQWLSDKVPDVLNFFWSVVIALIVWFVGVKISALIRKLMVKALDRHNVDKGVQQFLNSLVKWTIYIVLAVIILNLFGVTTTSAAAAVASLGVTAGLALQGSLSNFAGGVLILLLHPFRVGDYIIEDTHKNEGTVAEISIFYTKLKTVDNKIIVIPNGNLANTSLTNVTAADRRLIDLTVGISYDDDIKEAKNLLQQIMDAETRRLPDTDSNVFVSELGASSVNLGIRFWVKMGDYWSVRWDTLEKIKEVFDANGIHIPYDQMDVHLDKED